MEDRRFLKLAKQKFTNVRQLSSLGMAASVTVDQNRHLERAGTWARKAD